MLRWAAHEIANGMISRTTCAQLFGLDPGQFPERNLTRYLRTANRNNVLTDRILGPKERPVDSQTFQSQYYQLLEWLSVPDRLPSLACRLYALKVLLENRLFRLGNFYRRSKYDAFTNEAAASYELESGMLKQLKILEAEAKGNTTNVRDDQARQEINQTLMASFVPDAVQAGRIKDEELETRAGQARALTKSCSANPWQEYHALMYEMLLVWQRLSLFGSVPPESLIGIAEDAERSFNITRNAITAPDASSLLLAKVQLSDDFCYRTHYSLILAATWSGYYDRMQQSVTDEDKILAERSVNTMYTWALRSKGRGFVDILNLESGVGKVIRQAEQAQNDRQATGTDTIDTLAQGMRALDMPPNMPEHLVYGAAITKAQLDAMTRAKTFPSDVAIIDFIDAKCADAMLSIVHRFGLSRVVPLPEAVTMAKIQDWVINNLGIAKLEDKPLNDELAMSSLDELSGILEIITSTTLIRPGETIVLCPTGAMNRVPIHAIPVEGQPLIERNPVLYVQSLSVLYDLWRKTSTEKPSQRDPKLTVINPMPQTWETGDTVKSNPSNMELAKELQATLHNGFNLTEETVTSAIEKSTLFHYHGHVQFNRLSALDSAMILNEAAYRTALKARKPPNAESLTARQLFSTRLADGSLATIIGCGSGVTSVTATDDVLGFPTALLYAGASSIVSTLWPVDDEDGAEFATHFYWSLLSQKAENVRNPTGGDPATGLRKRLNVAKALQSAVKTLRSGLERSSAPYYWAAFTLNGLWTVREDIFHDAV